MGDAAFVLPRVKVCGITRATDARAALEAGADALGFVHYAQSPRHVGIEAIADLVAGLPPGVVTVLVVVDIEPRVLSALAARAKVSSVQLCGLENPTDWCDFSLPILRRIAVDPTAADQLRAWQGCAAGFVLDHPAAPGGTGRSVDVERAAELSKGAPCLLAGGLDGTVVGERIRRVRPVGVDGSSRLESAPGIKDHAALASFVGAALQALNESMRMP